MTNGYDPQNYPGTDTPVEAVNLPPYQDPNFQYILDQLQGLVGQGLDLVPPNVMQHIPWGQGRIQEWMTNMFTGKRAGRIGEQYETGQTDLLNRLAPKVMNRAKTGVIQGGGRGSSEMARTKSELTGKYYDALDQIGLNRIGLEENVRATDWNRGMQGAGALESVLRGDYQDALSQANLALQQTGQDAGILGQMGGLEGMDAQMANQFNVLLNQLVRSGADGNWLLDLLGAAAGGVAGYQTGTAG